MLAKPTPLALKSLYSFSQHAGWGEVSKFLEAELAATYEILTVAGDETLLRQMQGRAKFILDLQALVREAPTRLAQLRESTL